MKVPRMLWYLTMGVHLLLLWRILQEYRWPYGTRAWRQAWGALLATLIFLWLRRCLLYVYPQLLSEDWFRDLDPWTQVINTSLLYLFVWRLSTVFHVELPMTTKMEATIEIDSHSLIVGWSPQSEVLFGWTAEEVVGKKTLMQTIMLPQDWEAHRVGMARFQAAPNKAQRLPRTFQLTARTKDKTRMRVEIVVRTTYTADDGWRFQGTIRRLRTL